MELVQGTYQLDSDVPVSRRANAEAQAGVKVRLLIPLPINPTADQRAYYHWKQAIN